jgi:hypothetical protein
MNARHHILDYVRVMGLDRRDAEAERVKAAVPAAGTSGEDYSDLDGFAGLDELRTAIERRLLPERMGAVRVPFRTAVPFQGDAATGYWVSETGPKPVGRFSATGVALPSRKVEALAAVTKDLLRSPSPDADAAILRILRNAVVRRVNATFASSDAAVDGEAPAGIGAGATGAGDPAQIVAGLEAVVEAADTADTDLTAAEWVLSPAHAVEIAAAIGTDRLGLRGGELFGAPPIRTRPPKPSTWWTRPGSPSPWVRWRSRWPATLPSKWTTIRSTGARARPPRTWSACSRRTAWRSWWACSSTGRPWPAPCSPWVRSPDDDEGTTRLCAGQGGGPVRQEGYGSDPDLRDPVDIHAISDLLFDELGVVVEREVADRLRARYEVESEQIREMFDSQIEAWDSDDE